MLIENAGEKLQKLVGKVTNVHRQNGVLMDYWIRSVFSLMF